MSTYAIRPAPPRPTFREDLIERLRSLPREIEDQARRVKGAAHVLHNAKENLADREAYYLLGAPGEGEAPITGKNAEQREAQLRALTAPERSVVTRFQFEYEEERNQLGFLRDTFSAERAIARILAGGLE